jgi:hypothetical protein
MINTAQGINPPFNPSQSASSTFSYLIKNGDIGDVSSLYPETSFINDKKTMYFHFSIWERIYGEMVTDYAFLQFSLPENDLFYQKTILVFGSKKSRQLFRNWWKKYKQLFDDETYNLFCFPMPYCSSHISGDVVKFKLSHDDVESRMIDQSAINAEARDVWAWIVANSRGRIWRVPGAFVFANSADAVAFKLQWC